MATAAKSKTASKPKTAAKKKSDTGKSKATKTASKKGAPEKYSKQWFKEHKKNLDLSTWTETELVLLRRRSTRLFQKKQVPADLVMRICEAGRYAPTVGNGQYWRYSVVRDWDLLQEMTNHLYDVGIKMGPIIDYWKRPSMKPLVKFLQFLFPHDLHPIPHAVSRLIGLLNFDPLWGAPTVILLYKDVRCIGSPELNLGILGQNMITAAHSMGLGTCWVGLVKALNYYPKWKKLLDIQYPYVLSEAILVGYPVGEADGFIARDTHAIDWYEDGKVKTVY